MGRFIEGADRRQPTLLSEALDDYVEDDNPVRVVDAIIDALDPEALGFGGVVREDTGRPATILRRSAGENLRDVWRFSMAPISQDLEPPTNPGRFTQEWFEKLLRLIDR